RYVDKLFKVWLKDGAEAWVLIHVEIQSQRDDEFAERMYGYHSRLYERYRRPVVSLAVLGDEHPAWRPNHFGYSLGGCTLGFEFPVAKLLDYGADLAALEANPSPFAPFVVAHLKTMETRQDMAARKGWKMRLLKGLFERGFTGDEIRQLLRLIDWVMDLPEEMEEQVQEEMVRFGEEKNMPYVTSFERLGFKRGKAEGEAKGKAEGEAKGKADALLHVLERRFARGVSTDLEAFIRAATDLERLDRWLDLAFEAGSLDEFQRLAQR
ncbi:MAG TPA: Rpn family recombination-promoting nuclease/putative transposase, partial [Elusimicrobiota bacterium]|nr:Rpn family recombination-promoting nuclease/putative transposase [Elusimicrobiota bacterium]